MTFSRTLLPSGSLVDAGATEQIVGPEPRGASFASSVIRLICLVPPWPGQLRRYPALNMIRDLLLPELLTRFPSRGFQLENSGNTIGFFPAANPAVGNLYISDDGDEATLFIGELTHCHFDADYGETEIEKRITNDVLEFLDELFADRILIHKSRRTGADGSMPIEDASACSYLEPSDLTCVWSGPVRNPKLIDAG
jgi:hypothetical protein